MKKEAEILWIKNTYESGWILIVTSPRIAKTWQMKFSILSIYQNPH